MPRILVAESTGFSPTAATRLSELGTLTLADLDRDALLTAVKDADVLWVRLRHRIDAAVLDAGGRLQIIVTPTTGLNHIDLDDASRRGIRVLSLRGETDFLDGVVATAEHTLGLILALLRRIPMAAADVVDGHWNRDRFKGAEVSGKTAGVVGYGRLGRMVARYLTALGARVIAADPARTPDQMEPPVRLVALPELLERSDVVTVHVNLTEQTTGLFARPQFEQMRDGAWFVNTSRGEIVDERALLAALTSGKLAGAALDVLSGERSSGMADSPVVRYARDHRNLIVTPHIGGCTAESMDKTERFLAERLEQALASTPQ